MGRHKFIQNQRPLRRLFVPEKARWQFLQDRAKQPEIGKLVDEAMEAIEKINPSLKGVLPQIYADPDLNKQRFGELIDLIGTIGFQQEALTSKLAEQFAEGSKLEKIIRKNLKGIGYAAG
jgi:type I restriction-modification system DNA methylase subunit